MNEDKKSQDVSEIRQGNKYTEEQILQWKKDRDDRMNEITNKLESGVKEVFSSGKYEEYLKVMSRFHKYSVNNQILIKLQRPDAHLISGYKDWQRKFSRHVKKGETGIKILSPTPYKKRIEEEKRNPETGETVIEEKEVMMPAYKIATVFDISQTEGEPLPELGVSELDGKVEDYSILKEALMETAKVPISFDEIKGTAKGYYSPTNGDIHIRDGMSEVQTIKTLIHEMVHSERPNPEGSVMDEEMRRREEEIIAESAAFTVAARYGLDTSTYSLGYVAGWSADKDIKVLKSCLEEIRQISHNLIERVDEKILEKCRDKEKVAERNVSFKEDTIKLYCEDRPHHRCR